MRRARDDVRLVPHRAGAEHVHIDAHAYPPQASLEGHAAKVLKTRLKRNVIL